MKYIIVIQEKNSQSKETLDERKREPKCYQGKDKQTFRSMTKYHEQKYHEFVNKFGYLEGDIIVGGYYECTTITLAERLSKYIIKIKKGSESSGCRKITTRTIENPPRNILKQSLLLMRRVFKHNNISH